MNVYVASRRSARRLLWLVLPLTSRPFLGSIPGFTAFETSQTHRIASRFSVPSLPSLDRIGSNPNEPARNASSQLRGFGPPQETFSSHVRSFAAWSVVGASSRPADAEASEAETSIFGSESLPRSKPLITVQADLKTRTVQDEEREDGGGGRRSIRKVKGEEKGGGDERVEWVIAGNAAGKSEGGKRKSNRTGACKEEEEAVAVIAGVLREKFGPQIVREVEELGSGMRSSENDERVKVKEEEEGEEGDDEEAEEEEDEDDAEGETCEEDSPPTTSPPTHPPQLYNRRVVSPSSLLSLYRFFSSHLGISSPSTVASLLVTYPQLLRSNPTNDFLPRVRLLQSYGISHADIAHVTVKAPPWLRVPLEQIQNTLEFLLAQGVHRSRLAPPSRPAATTAAAAARATAAAGGGAAGSTGAARGGQQRSLPLPDDPTPQQLREGVIQRGSPGGGGFGFMWPQRPCDCASQRCVPGRVEAAALGSSESAVAPGAGESAAALGARESAVALGASASTATGPASTEALHTFTLDSDASHCFFRDCTTVTPLAAPIPVSLADPTGGPVAERASTGP
ncbi:unnamed protein product [Closterium sp. NIES-54]